MCIKICCVVDSISLQIQTSAKYREFIIIALLCTYIYSFFPPMNKYRPGKMMLSVGREVKGEAVIIYFSNLSFVALFIKLSEKQQMGKTTLMIFLSFSQLLTFCFFNT